MDSDVSIAQHGPRAAGQAGSGRLRSLGVVFRRAVFGVGPIATARAALRHVRRADAEVHVPGTANASLPHPFDVAFGVDTGGFVSWRDLQAGGANDPYISGYIGVAPSIGRHAIARVEDVSDYVFVDIGCGKGRATILASERPFRRVIGVEIAAALAAQARENAAIIAARYPERPAIEIAHGDAAEFELPRDPLILFLYQPFERPVMRRIMARLATSLAETPRPVALIYIYPALASFIDRFSFLERIAEEACEMTEEERPFSYGGRGGTDKVVIWGTRAPRPSLAAH
jgi:Methyltransferase domain